MASIHRCLRLRTVLWYYYTGKLVLRNAVMKTLSLKVPAALDRRLAAVVARRGISKSQAIRAALEAYLDAEGSAGRGSVLDLAADLVGCVRGPGDLSINPKHLKDFGK
jgi:hypothetical protein